MSKEKHKPGEDDLLNDGVSHYASDPHAMREAPGGDSHTRCRILPAAGRTNREGMQVTTMLPEPAMQQQDEQRRLPGSTARRGWIRDPCTIKHGFFYLGYVYNVYSRREHDAQGSKR